MLTEPSVSISAIWDIILRYYCQSQNYHDFHVVFMRFVMDAEKGRERFNSVIEHPSVDSNVPGMNEGRVL